MPYGSLFGPGLSDTVRPGTIEGVLARGDLLLLKGGGRRGNGWLEVQRFEVLQPAVVVRSCGSLHTAGDILAVCNSSLSSYTAVV
jgi:hypothetical protein